MDRSHIAKAYDLWLRAAAGRKNQWRIAKEHGGADPLIDELAEEIGRRCLQLRPIHRYKHCEPTNGKVRIIGVESAKQQVLDYAIVLAIQPLLDAKLGFWQVAGIPGKGQLACKRAMRKWVREGGYHVKLDVRQCYSSISHHVVKRIIVGYVRSPDVLYCIDAVLATYGEGLEIGSYFSLQMANLVLSFVYHHLEALHKMRRGRSVPLIAHQLWHMDDALIIGPDKRNLKMAVHSATRYMSSELGLEVKPWKIAKTGDAEPLDMGGFIVRNGRCTLRASVFLRAARAFRRFAKSKSRRLAQRVCSYWGWLINTDSDALILGNSFNQLFRIARGIISRAERGGQWTTLAAQPS